MPTILQRQQRDIIFHCTFRSKSSQKYLFIVLIIQLLVIVLEVHIELILGQGEYMLEE